MGKITTPPEPGSFVDLGHGVLEPEPVAHDDLAAETGDAEVNDYDAHPDPEED